MHRWCFDCLSGSELGNDVRMVFLRIFSVLWELMISRESIVIP